jgi:hypothetical protein
VRIDLLEFAQERDAIHRLHLHIGEDEIELVRLVAFERLVPIGGEGRSESDGLDDRFQHFVDGGKVVDDEDRRHVGEETTALALGQAQESVEGRLGIGYWLPPTTLARLKIGRNIAMTMLPTKIPKKQIRSGSMRM